MTNILCVSCKKPINSDKDLIVTINYFFSIIPFHSACYHKKYDEKLRKMGRSFVLLNNIINDMGGTIVLTIISIGGFFSLILYFVDKNAKFPPAIDILFVFLMTVAIIMPLFIRFYSYYKYERPLKNIK